uniref:Putative zinc finger, CCHC-type n=1 Tax=Helianthus annuus TaxID=4232 RepID=A0A251S8E3_HELAN
MSTLVGLDLDQFVDRLTSSPPKELDSKTNPAYRLWHRQDQILLRALLGSCSDLVQAIVSSAATSHEFFKRLTETYASTSRSRVISLKTQLATHSKGDKPIAQFLNEMKAIADELAFAQSPIKDEDLIVHSIAHLGDDYKHITAATKMRDTPMTFTDMYDKLVDHERTLFSSHPTPAISTVNQTQRQGGRHSFRSGNEARVSNRPNNYGSRYNKAQGQTGGPNNFSRGNRNSFFCQYCNIPGHDTKECRKLARFLQNNNITIASASSSNPQVNSSMASSSSSLTFDTGATDHAAPNQAFMHNLSEYGGPDEIVLGNGNTLSISHIGHSSIPTSSRSLLLQNVLLVPKLRNRLISVAKLCKTNQVSVEFFPFHFLVKDLRTGAHLMRGVNVNDVYYATSNPPHPPIQVHSSIKTPTSLLSWHHIFGHPSIQVLKRLLNKLGLVYNNTSASSFHCDACSLNKSHKLPFGENSFIASKPLELVYTDVWGPVQTSNDGYSYYVLFVDFYSKYNWLYPIKKKSDVSILFPQFKTLVENFFRTPLVSIFSDNGGEYIGLASYFQRNGISHFTTPPHTPEQNGVAERRHRHIVETGLSLLSHANLPLTFWSHAFQTAVHLINRLPTKILNFLSPFEKLHKTSPTYTKLKPFGCLCFPWLRPYAKSKLHNRSSKCIFLGYSSSKSAYKCYDPSSQHLYHSRHVEFVDHMFPFKTQANDPTPLPTPTTSIHTVYNNSTTPPNTTSPSMHFSNPITNPSHTTTNPPNPVSPFSQPISNSLTSNSTSNSHTTTSPPDSPPLHADTQSSSNSIPANSLPNADIQSLSNPTPADYNQTPADSQPSPSTAATSTTETNSSSPAPSQPQRIRKPNPKYYNSHHTNNTTLHPLPPTLEPTTHNQASKDPHWRAAMDSEFNALLQNQTWELVPATPDKPIGCKWVFRIKRNPDGSIEKYKARLVAKGFLQQHEQHGKDYFDTFSPVTKPIPFEPSSPSHSPKIGHCVN